MLIVDDADAFATQIMAMDYRWKSNATGKYCCGAGNASGGCCAADGFFRHTGSGAEHTDLNAITSGPTAVGAETSPSDVGDVTAMSVAQAAAVIRAASQGKARISTAGLSTERIAELLQSGSLLADLNTMNTMDNVDNVAATSV